MPSSKRFHGWTNRRLRRLEASFVGFTPRWRLEGKVSGVEDGFGLQVGVVGGAHHRAAGDLVETN